MQHTRPPDHTGGFFCAATGSRDDLIYKIASKTHQDRDGKAPNAITSLPGSCPSPPGNIATVETLQPF
jgi:hypothetical protein